MLMGGAFGDLLLLSLLMQLSAKFIVELCGLFLVGGGWGGRWSLVVDAHLAPEPRLALVGVSRCSC